jgi:hypothetical protein
LHRAYPSRIIVGDADAVPEDARRPPESNATNRRIAVEDLIQHRRLLRECKYGATANPLKIQAVVAKTYES